MPHNNKEIQLYLAVGGKNGFKKMCYPRHLSALKNRYKDFKVEIRLKEQLDMIKNSAEQCKQDSKEDEKKKKTQESRLPQNHKKAVLEFQQDNNYENLIVIWLQLATT